MPDYWFTFRFNMRETDPTNPQLFLDLALIDLVIRNIVASNETCPKLWRLHRRSDRKADSHMVTFRCFTTRNQASSINSLISHDPPMKVLLSQRLVSKYTWEDETTPDSKLKSERNATAGNWAVPIKDCWPTFAMGFSQSLLEILEAIRVSKDKRTETLIQGTSAAIELFYQEVDCDISRFWKKQGADAFLHHSHAIFGYPQFEALITDILGEPKLTTLEHIHSYPQ